MNHGRSKHKRRYGNGGGKPERSQNIPIPCTAFAKKLLDEEIKRLDGLLQNEQNNCSTDFSGSIEDVAVRNAKADLSAHYARLDQLRILAQSAVVSQELSPEVGRIGFGSVVIGNYEGEEEPVNLWILGPVELAISKTHQFSTASNAVGLKEPVVTSIDSPLARALTELDSPTNGGRVSFNIYTNDGSDCFTNTFTVHSFHNTI